MLAFYTFIKLTSFTIFNVKLKIILKFFFINRITNRIRNIDDDQ